MHAHKMLWLACTAAIVVHNINLLKCHLKSAIRKAFLHVNGNLVVHNYVTTVQPECKVKITL